MVILPDQPFNLLPPDWLVHQLGSQPVKAFRVAGGEIPHLPPMSLIILVLADHTLHLPGDGRAGIDDFYLWPDNLPQDWSQKRKVRAAQHELVNPRIEQGPEICPYSAIGLFRVELPVLNQRHEVGANLSDHLDPVGKPFNHTGK